MKEERVEVALRMNRVKVFIDTATKTTGYISWREKKNPHPKLSAVGMHK